MRVSSIGHHRALIAFTPLALGMCPLMDDALLIPSLCHMQRDELAHESSTALCLRVHNGTEPVCEGITIIFIWW